MLHVACFIAVVIGVLVSLSVDCGLWTCTAIYTVFNRSQNAPRNLVAYFFLPQRFRYASLNSHGKRNSHSKDREIATESGHLDEEIRLNL